MEHRTPTPFPSKVDVWDYEITSQYEDPSFAKDLEQLSGSEPLKTLIGSKKASNYFET